MSKNKNRYYWIKIKDSFLTSQNVDFLMSQNEGANYVVLYQMLCLLAINTNGKLARMLGDIYVPFDIEKLKRDLKFFSIDTIRVGIELFLKLGLVSHDENGALLIENFDNIVGSESKSAARVREHRERKALQCNTNVTPEALHCNKNVTPCVLPPNYDNSINPPGDIRDKRLDSRDIDNDDDIENIEINNTDVYFLSDRLVRSNFISMNSFEYYQISLDLDRRLQALEIEFLDRLITEFNSFLSKKKPIITDKVAYFSAFLNNAQKYAAAWGYPSHVDENAARIIQAATKEWQERNS